MSLPAGDHAAAVVEPGKEPFDCPAALRASQRPAVLRLRAAPTIRRDHLDAVLRHQQVVESIAVIAAVADQAPREVGEEARVEGGGDGPPILHFAQSWRLARAYRASRGSLLLTTTWLESFSVRYISRVVSITYIDELTLLYRET